MDEGERGPASEGVETILRKIREAARRVGRDPGEIHLVAVTKTVEVERIREVYRQGVRIFGESRVQEALPKLAALPGDAVWHFIGPLQRNKVRQVVGRFALIHSVDSVPLAGEIGRRAAAMGTVQRILLEVNLSGEAGKHGVSAAEAPGAAEAIGKVPGLSLDGLMTIPPYREDPEEVRPFFRALRELGRRIGPSLREFSMGMSHDFEVAVEEGATFVRVGSAIFGERGRA